jgi:hypothetical protein
MEYLNAWHTWRVFDCSDRSHWLLGVQTERWIGYFLSSSCCLTITSEAMAIWDSQIWLLFYARCQAACMQGLIALAPHIEILKLTFVGYRSFNSFSSSSNHHFKDLMGDWRLWDVHIPSIASISSEETICCCSGSMAVDGFGGNGSAVAVPTRPFLVQWKCHLFWRLSKHGPFQTFFSRI